MALDPVPELVLDRYRVGSRLAAGAAGTVVAAVDTVTGRDVVVKFFDGSEDNFAAWVREVRLAMRLRHPNIPACLNAGHDAGWGLSVLVFERAQGGSLRRALAGGRAFDDSATRRLLADVAAALAHAHALGVIHRDVKPENILARDAPGESPWLLADFGAGRFLARGAVSRPLGSSPAGSWLYMAPEAMHRGAVPASDQYSLGVVGLELRAGAVPDRRGRSEFRLAHADAGGLDGLLARLTAPDPARRFPALEAAAAALAGPADAAVDVTATRDGYHFALVGVDVFVRRPGAADLEHVGRVPGARAFVNAWGDPCALLAAADRLLALSPFARAIGPAPPRTFVASDRGALWSLDGDAVSVKDASGELHRAPLAIPDAWRAGKLLGVRLDGGGALLGARGCDRLAWIEPDGRGVRARPVAGPGPLYDLRRIHDVPIAVFGDATSASAAIVGDADLGPLARCDQAVDELTIALRGRELELTPLFPAVVAMVEDEA